MDKLEKMANHISVKELIETMIKEEESGIENYDVLYSAMQYYEFSPMSLVVIRAIIEDERSHARLLKQIVETGW